jgi:pimeloyl-ACP methyl ester carboxylesterase
MTEITQRLLHFMRGVPADTLHWVGHSLGGLVILRFLERVSAPPGRVVFLGTPAVASLAVERAARLRVLASLMGRCVGEELVVKRPRRWSDAHPLGVIAGTRSMGFGKLFARFSEDNDGTVAVSETRLAGATEHLLLPVSHMGLLLSARVAHATGAFLRTGHFGSARSVHSGPRPSSARSR